MKKHYVALFDNYVTDDILILRIEADTEEEADEIAYEQSMKTGYSEGNYELYQNTSDFIDFN